MAFEEEAAYALAAWQRFDSNVSDDLLRAITGAFALVAAVDGDLAQSEIDQFVTLVGNRTDALAAVDFTRLDRGFRDVCTALMSDPPRGEATALNYVAAIKENPQHCELVRSAAEIAVAADGRSLAQEHTALNHICQTLGVPPRP